MPLGILILEPDPMQQVGFRAALASAGFAATTVETVQTASERLRDHAFGLLLIGPGQDAVAIARVLRADADTTSPIVALDRLPDCMVGHAIPGEQSKLPAELPAVLEALTRYMRFAPPRSPEDRPDQADLLEGWARFEEGRPP